MRFFAAKTISRAAVHTATPLPDHTLGQGHALRFSGFLVNFYVLEPDGLVCVEILTLNNGGIGFVHIQRIHIFSEKRFNDQCEGVI